MQPAVRLAGINPLGKPIVCVEVEDRKGERLAERCVLKPKPEPLVVRKRAAIPGLGRAGDELCRDVVGVCSIDLPEKLDLPLAQMAAAFAQKKRQRFAHGFF